MADHFRIYHVGASLTWDCAPTLVRDILVSNGHSVDLGYNITCGKSLTHILANPEDTCIPVPEPYGWWPEALANYDWDAVTFQMFAGQGSTGESELAALSTMIELLTSGGRNQNCKIYVYVGWPSIGSETYSEIYNSPYADPTQPPPRVAAFLDYLYFEITQLHPQLDIRTIPTGRVLDIIDQKLREVPLDGYTNAYDLYRDTVHIGFGAGTHLASMSLLTAILGEDVRNLSLPVWDYPINVLAREIIWFTFSSDPRTGVPPGAPTLQLDRNGSRYFAPELNLPSGYVNTANNNRIEIYFSGALQHSQDLSTWTTLENATSPHRIDTGTTPGFFRSIIR